MKLIEILISELPKRGGWPETASTATQDSDGEICFSSGGKHEYCTASWKGGEWTGDGFMAEHAIDYERSIITREQYEAALKKKLEVIAERQPITEPSWDGSGLPPVGCECEFTLGPYEPDELDDLCGKLPWPGTLVTVVSHKVTGDGHNVAVIYWDEYGGGHAACLIGSCLKPIRSEADKKRDAVIHEIAEAMVAPQPKGNGILAQAISVYNKIAAGKIPGVKLED